ncbi:ATP synthase F1 subunit gamma [Ruminiclostridium cellulolyticum]|uniref:ATP synthase gamma chain n=1 Tax=Ruminiclostridium cellulolyticum (strain ATCC 35319 / DSM 5812 / JCM 6584 / H10) TaxID=394503 RepID=ATPG_RUMCH|nr:ATP synthase F1 subunit gamma [Ruminiclostridium cellulolyticum]B8I578.1 RecName: Full=ATP synthase gamma chain; AltName: Full=ATP synthase F1 sector gamma subunit; AltName: Full=F-ATPase gamma subunit [Ruminiclostridium cellulolyticum H10]ACL74658.1 ATP synthase F1, gamma subunit [Ruminiclostridium cellulolyticum H10]
MANNMREIKSRIKSINQMRQITKAMKLISASKLKKARAQLEETLPYYNKVKETIADILAHSAEVESRFFDIREEKEGKKKAYIVMAGDKGLAGGYNSNIFKLTEHEIGDNKENALLLVAGTTGRSYFSRKEYHVHTEFDYAVQNPTVFRAREITEIILDLYNKQEVDEVYIVYTQMISAISLEPRILKLLPIEISALREDVKADEIVLDQRLKYEPSVTEVLNVLIPKYIKGIMYGTFVEAFTSEQNARMTAMDNATKNADEMLQKLNLYYNRARQATITQEISEIVGGASALE